jgi:F-type H+-transporting ATPase subunit epsilon
MFTLTVVTPEKKIFTSQEIEEVFVPAFRGELNILPGHAPLMTTLTPGILKYRLAGEAAYHHAAISWGYCQVNPQGVNILAETAERPEDLDVERIEEAIKNAEAQVQSSAIEPELIQKYQLKLRRALVRKEVASFARTH